ncbi:MAG: helix-turn-helix domain-containing protein [Phenylobacterium sp.]|uniref:TetR/AcrR family transcriptional regulator n=1 Tax=Phenylobacterium sp. TaxID=1871053 RepID=UPI0027253363|nr:TetR/AcrR family transcriptional regulator [Phenylobacterium sp.]MDO8901279.1 helix-turn-helix domain-containing protein [Phenylobacterium sp.]
MRTPRRRLDPADRRRELLAAAERLIRRRADQVRVEDVVAEAGAAKGTFYLYFATWDDLLEALRNELFDRFEAQAPEPVESLDPIDWPATLRGMARAYIAFNLEMEGLHDALFHSDFARNRPVPRHRGGPARLAAMIRAGQEAGAFGPVAPDLTARMIFAAMHEAADAAREGEDLRDVTAALDTLMNRALTPEFAP